MTNTHTAFAVSSMLRLRRFDRGTSAGNSHRTTKITLGSNPDSKSDNEVGIMSRTSRYSLWLIGLKYIAAIQYNQVWDCKSTFHQQLNKLFLFF